MPRLGTSSPSLLAAEAIYLIVDLIWFLSQIVDPWVHNWPVKPCILITGVAIFRASDELGPFDSFLEIILVIDLHTQKRSTMCTDLDREMK